MFFKVILFIMIFYLDYQLFNLLELTRIIIMEIDNYGNEENK